MGYRWAWDCIPADLFIDILRRLPPSPRRRLRLVCRHWRNVIDDHMPATQARAMVLAFAVGHGRPRAYVLDNLTEQGTGGGRELKLPGAAAAFPVVSMVGTCNGLLCLRHWDDDLVVLNLVTGKKLAIPPPSESLRLTKVVSEYSFTYHAATGLYKIVHVPCYGAVKVFTLGDTLWREVPAPVGTSRVTSLGIASVDGATYWVAVHPHSLYSVMSLGLKDERVVFVATLPVCIDQLGLSCQLTTDLRGRLIFAVCSREMKDATPLMGIQTEVWMLDDGGRRNQTRPTWVLQCKVEEPGQEPPQQMARPHVTHGEHVLTTRAKGDNQVSLHACRLSGDGRTHGGVVRTEGSPSIGMYDYCRSLRTFAYVETTEPLAIYGANDCNIGDNEVWYWRFDEGERQWKLMRLTRSLLIPPPAS